VKSEKSNKEIKSVFLVSRFTFDVSRALQHVIVLPIKSLFFVLEIFLSLFLILDF